MRVLVAGGALKGTLDCQAATAAIAAGVAQAGHHPIPVPVADGGDGSLAALQAAGFARRTANAKDAAGREVAAAFAWNPGTRTAAVELAQASGLWRVQRDARDPWRLTTYGFGELLRAALVLRPLRVLALLGGSATQDAGAGMLQSLGAILSPPPGLADALWLEHATGIDLRPARRLFAGVELLALSDVDHVLSGPGGSAQAFARQKGFQAADVPRLDAAISRFAALLAAASGRQIEAPGSGAAGGAGAALIALGGQVVGGAEQIFATVGFFAQLADADAVISCEGRVDATTWRGKAPGLAMQAALARGLPAFLLCAEDGPGSQREGVRVIRAQGSPVLARDLQTAAARALRELAAGH